MLVILLVSGLSYRQGVDAYLPKPVKPEELLMYQNKSICDATESTFGTDSFRQRMDMASVFSLILLVSPDFRKNRWLIDDLDYHNCYSCSVNSQNSSPQNQTSWLTVVLLGLF